MIQVHCTVDRVTSVKVRVNSNFLARQTKKIISDMNQIKLKFLVNQIRTTDVILPAIDSGSKFHLCLLDLIWCSTCYLDQSQEYLFAFAICIYLLAKLRPSKWTFLDPKFIKHAIILPDFGRKFSVFCRKRCKLSCHENNRTSDRGILKYRTFCPFWDLLIVNRTRSLNIGQSY